MKLKRAEFHLETLQASMKGWVQSGPYATWDDPIEPEAPYVESFIVRATEKQRPPKEEWGAMIGDVVHSLRSALDHLVWELTKQHQGGVPSPPLPRSWRRIGFPIYRVDDANSRARIDEALWGIDPVLKADFETLQPFAAFEPDTHPLWILHELSNIDKHRHVHLTVVHSLIRDIGYIAAGKGIFEMTKGSEPELYDNVEMFRVHREEIVPELPGISVELRGESKIRFGPDSPAKGLTAIEALDRLYGVVNSILLGFESKLI